VHMPDTPALLRPHVGHANDRPAPGSPSLVPLCSLPSSRPSRASRTAPTPFRSTSPPTPARRGSRPALSADAAADARKPPGPTASRHPRLAQ
jgi:hypothetical protein